MARARLRELGITVGVLPTGEFNAITDVAGVKVGYFTLIHDTPQIVRTGITAIWPRGPEIWTDYVFAGTFSFNGNGEMTGLPWIAEQGTLGAPIGITNPHFSHHFSIVDLMPEAQAFWWLPRNMLLV
jgi:D-aminopeptidase